MPTTEHTLKQFDTELEAVRARVLQMGGLVEEQIVRALDALSNGNIPLAERVVEDDHRVNALEVAIDEECSTIIARRQPAAGDLRMLMMVVKTITDLERIGDEAAKIARMAQLIYEAGRPSVPRTTEIRHVAETRARHAAERRSMRSRASTSPWRRGSCARTSRWTRPSAASCASSSPS